MSEERTEPRTLVGLWLLAMSHRELDRREAIRGQIDQKEGWTKSEVGVVEAAFELGIQAYFGGRTRSEHIQSCRGTTPTSENTHVDQPFQACNRVPNVRL